MDQTAADAGDRWIGQPLPRLEDERLLTGRGSFTDDVVLPGQAHAAFVRSPHPHARIVSIDASAARAVPGVLAVLTGDDAVRAGLRSLPFVRMHKRPNGDAITAAPRLPVSAGVVRFVGDAVALVVAETRDAARDAAEQVAVEWQPLPAVVDLAGSALPDAPVVWEPAFDPSLGNIAALYRAGDRGAVDEAFRRAARTVRLAVVNNRVIAHPLEARGANAEFDPASGRWTVYCPIQSVHRGRHDLASAFGLPEERFRVVVRDLGGGFGARGYCYPEYVAVAWAARVVGRPVKWLGDRSELFLCDVHGRDQLTDAEIALDAGLRFTALRLTTLADVGAYASYFGAAVPAMSGARAATGCYDIPLIDHEVRMMFTHTAPVDAYRGAGRPEMGYLIERLVHKAALELGVDPTELKRRNFVRPEQMPYRNAVGWTIEAGAFERQMERAMAAMDWAGFDARRIASEARGRLRGRATASYVEITGTAALTEEVDVEVRGDGTIRVVCGTQSMGQGLQTAFAQVFAERLQVHPSRVEVFEGDSAVVRSGGGSGGSRSLQVGGNAVLAAGEATVERGYELAGRALEAARGDIEYGLGTYRIAGTDRSITLAELAGREPGGVLKVSASATAAGQTWPNGCQAVEVEVDPETGSVRVAAIAAADDIGRVVNPLIAHGQIQGGIAQGIGQALLENVVYDRDTGQLVTGSFLDYAMPRADDLPSMQTLFDESLPSRHNALGAKGVGESGTHGAAPAVVNAVVDALAARGIAHLDMPLTVEKVWRAIRDAGAR